MRLSWSAIPPLHIVLRVGTDVLLHYHHVLDQHLGVIGKHPQDAAFLALVAAGDNFHRVVAADIHSFVHCR